MKYFQRAKVLIRAVSRSRLSSSMTPPPPPSNRSTLAKAAGVLCLAIGGLTATRFVYADSAASTATQTSSGDVEADVEEGKDCRRDDYDVDKEVEARQKRLKRAQVESQKLIDALMDKSGAPGLTIAVNIDGETVLKKGFGYADVENSVKCCPETVMRVASVGKTMTMAIAAKQMELGQLDLDKDVAEYVKTWPQKSYDGEKVTITTRQLLSHLSGIRHYDKTCKNKYPNNDKDTDAEVYSTRSYKTTTEALTMFKDDDLCSKPGTEYNYTTHGWTLLSAVLESISGQSFETLISAVFNDLSLKNTYLDKHEPIISNRARFYQRKGKGTLINSPYVDPSYKFSGGGLLSNVLDIATFGDVMLYSFQGNTADPKCYLKPATMKQMWTQVQSSKCTWDREGKTGLTWAIVEDKQTYGGGRCSRFYTSHTGGGIGSSSVLLILPSRGGDDGESSSSGNPRGVTVAMITNMQSVALNSLAKKIALLYESVDL